MKRCVIALCLTALASAAPAQNEAAAVGRLDITGKGFCTAALIRDDLILTAAHCLLDRTGALIGLEQFSFQAGLRDGRAMATRGIRQAVVHPAYASTAETLALDIAVLALDRPIQSLGLRPFAIADRPLTGDILGLVSYDQRHAERPRQQDQCHVLGRQTGALILRCEADFGASGAPVFARFGDEMRIASVVSAAADMQGERVILGTALDGALHLLLSALADAPPKRGARRLQPGERAATGARVITRD